MHALLRVFSVLLITLIPVIFYFQFYYVNYTDTSHFFIFSFITLITLIPVIFYFRFYYVDYIDTSHFYFRLLFWKICGEGGVKVSR